MAVPLPTNAATPVTAVNVTYNFPNRDEVWLDGVGTLPPTGELHYVLRTKQMTFRDQRSGKVLQMLDVTPTTIHMGGTLALFPDTTTVDKWIKFSVQLTLNKPTRELPRILFELAADPNTPVQLSLSPCRPDDDGCLVSQWERITSRAAPIQVDFSMMITYKAAGTAENPVTTATIYYTARQGYLGAGEIPNADPSPETINICRHKMKAIQDLLIKRTGT
jgi:hypothetical protein